MSSWRTEVRKTLALALPIIAVQIGMKAMGTVDVMMVGHHSPLGLAAITLGELYIWGLLIFGLGILTAFDPVISQAVGARDEQAIRLGVQRGLCLALILSIPVTLALLPASWVFSSLDQPAEIIPAAAEYVLYSLPGVLPFFVYAVLRVGLQALSCVRPIVLVIVSANLLNVFLDWLLIFGNWGCPELGLKGSAIATSICRWVMAIGLVLMAMPRLAPYLKPSGSNILDVAAIAKLLRLGLPIGLQYFLEMGVFAFTALLVGWFGSVALAGHQIAINLAALTFMIPLGLSSAVAVRVGYAIGAGDMQAARHAANAALLFGGGVMVVFAALFLSIPAVFTVPYTDDPRVIAIAVALIPIAGVFQVFDGLQVAALGILRGMGKTLIASLVSLFGFWMLGLPVGCLLAFYMGLGPVGLWWGLVTALATVAVILMMFVRRSLAGEVDRFETDRPA
ncbi:MAG: MATE family efflux transporter [Planctomycetota bacterium]|jgi:MATE family multidrug resistance protein